MFWNKHSGLYLDLPNVSGVSEGHVISAETAYNLARDYGLRISFDEEHNLLILYIKIITLSALFVLEMLEL